RSPRTSSRGCSISSPSRSSRSRPKNARRPKSTSERRSSFVLASILLAFLAAAPPELAVPKHDGWVTDLAGMLSPPKERELETLMESYKQGTTHEIALLTIPSLEGDDLERFALRVFRTWGIGSKSTSNGALLVVSKADRKIRIEVGRGLEGNLTDS